MDAVRELGADVVLFGDNFAEAKAHCAELCAGGQQAFVDAFDDPLGIAGQGTVGQELVRQATAV